MDGPVLTTARLTLRPPREGDFEAWAATHADEGVARYTSFVPLTRHDAWRHMAGVMGHWLMRGYGFFSVIETESGQWVGRVGPWYPETWLAPEVGWTIAPQAQGRGYAVEAAVAAMDFAVDTLNWPEISHLILAGNTASERVAARLGSAVVRRGDLMGKGEGAVWGQSAGDWRVNRQAFV